MSSLLDDYRKRPCPNCGKTGIYLDPSSNDFRCPHCKASGFKFNEDKRPTEERKSNVPPNAPLADVVEDWWTDETGNRHKVSTVYCPKERMQKHEKFDPDSPWVRVAMIRFKKNIDNRRRYNRDLIKRARERDQVLHPWTERWEAERGPLSPIVADRLLQRVRESRRRRNESTRHQEAN